MPASDTQHEYYIRQPDDAEARGPFTLAQIGALADEGAIDSRTLYFDAAGEQWLPVAGSVEFGILLRGAPSRARGRESAQSRAGAATGAGAGANANADAHAHADADADADADAARAGKLARVLLFASATALLLMAFVYASGVSAADASAPGGGGGGGGWSWIRVLLAQPFFWLGAIDVFLGAWLSARAGGLTGRLALVVRLRAAVGLGLLGVFLWLVAAVPALVLAVPASACLWLATVLKGRRAPLVNAIAGLAALTGFACCVVA